VEREEETEEGSKDVSGVVRGAVVVLIARRRLRSNNCCGVSIALSETMSFLGICEKNNETKEVRTHDDGDGDDDGDDDDDDDDDDDVNFNRKRSRREEKRREER
jgi:hypothetical protein